MREVDQIADLLPEKIDALLIAGGNRPIRSLISLMASRSRNLIAIDGGLRHVRHFDLRPDFIIGDFDSVILDDLTWARRKRAKIELREEQDSSDMDKALYFCKNKKWKNIVIAGADGSRTDHFLYAVSGALAIKKLSLTFVFHHAVARSLRGPARLELPMRKGRVFSWLGMPEAKCAMLSGAKWPFTDRTLKIGEFQSLSNVSAETKVILSQRSGTSLIIIPIGQV